MPKPSKRRAPGVIEASSPKKKKRSSNNSRDVDDKSTKNKQMKKVFIDRSKYQLLEPISDEEARSRWPERYDITKKQHQNDEVLLAHCHYMQAKVEGSIYKLYDDAYIKGENGGPNLIGKIVEIFESINKEPYFTAQWFFRAKDTVIGVHANLIGDKRVFYSSLKDDNPLNCLVSKIDIVKVAVEIDPSNEKNIPCCDFYYNMLYSMDFSTFIHLSNGGSEIVGCKMSSTNTSGANSKNASVKTCALENSSKAHTSQRSEMTLLDLYSGCGAMSTGLCLGAELSGVNLVTKWAVDFNKHACKSLKENHPETKVINETAENFLALLKEWKKLCDELGLLGIEHLQSNDTPNFPDEEKQDEDEEEKQDEEDVDDGEFIVEKLIGICYGDPKGNKKIGLYFKVHWLGYGPQEDTWEPRDGLGNCEESIRSFVVDGLKKGILPLPGDVDIICGGPPCQGISGFNRFRNKIAPLKDPKNRQLLVFMDIVDFLRPKYVLMENVVDLMKFAGGDLGRYAMSRLVALNYQARLGMMVAGCYGVAQFRMRVFLWGAHSSQKLPQFPLPTHEVKVQGIYPIAFERNVVAYDEDQICMLENALHLKDAISDLPPVENNEGRDVMAYTKVAQTEFQRQIRLCKKELVGFDAMLYDHRPLHLNEDDYQRVCQIPKRKVYNTFFDEENNIISFCSTGSLKWMQGYAQSGKGANFRDLPGVLVGPKNTAEWDESIERVLLPSGKPLVPDYAMSFVKGHSTKPFGRVWWDEIIPTIVTRAQPHNRAVLHPEQDRVLSVRENARLQGFPDHYKLFGSIKERYIQVGNAVAVPVSRALGYALGLASEGNGDEEPLLTLPPNFPNLS